MVISIFLLLSYRNPFTSWEWKGTKLLLFYVDITNLAIKKPIRWSELVLHLEKEKTRQRGRENKNRAGESVCRHSRCPNRAVPTPVMPWTTVANDDLTMATPKAEAHSFPAIQYNTPPTIPSHRCSCFSFTLQKSSFIISHCPRASGQKFQDCGPFKNVFCAKRPFFLLFNFPSLLRFLCSL